MPFVHEQDLPYAISDGTIFHYLDTFVKWKCVFKAYYRKELLLPSLMQQNEEWDPGAEFL